MEDQLGRIELKVRPLRVLQLLLTISALSILVSLVLRLMWVSGRLQGMNFTINELLNVDAEGNPPTWFGSMMLFTSALLALAIAQKNSGAQGRGWYILAAALTWMSLDESSSLHEQAGRPLRDLFDTSGVLYFAWVLLAIPLVLVIGALVLPVLSSLKGLEKRNLFIAGGLYLAGALGGEMVSGLESDDFQSSRYVIVTHTEEALEFAGAAFLIFALSSIAIRMSGRAPLAPETSNTAVGGS